MLENNEVVHSGEFNAELIFTDSPFSENNNQIQGEVFDNDGEFILKLPVIEDAKKLRIKTADKTLALDIEDLGGRPCKI